MFFAVGNLVQFGYNGRIRKVRIEKVGTGYITGQVVNENGVYKSFRFAKMVNKQMATILGYPYQVAQ